MPTIGEMLKNLVRSRTRAAKIEPEAVRRMKKVQEAAKETSKALKIEKGKL